eukprot:264402-Chlamydomonas_euryale.AAC.2
MKLAHNAAMMNKPLGTRSTNIDSRFYTECSTYTEVGPPVDTYPMLQLFPFQYGVNCLNNFDAGSSTCSGTSTSRLLLRLCPCSPAS